MDAYPRAPVRAFLEELRSAATAAAGSMLESREETKGRFCKRAVLAHVPSFRIFLVQEYQKS